MGLRLLTTWTLGMPDQRVRPSWNRGVLGMGKVGREFLFCEGAPYMILETPRSGGECGACNGNICYGVELLLDPRCA